MPPDARRDAITAYDDRGKLHAAETREQARGELVECWGRDRASVPGATRIILTHTNDEVHAINLAAREKLRGSDQVGDDVTIHTERGERQFARGDRIMFLNNERELGVKNGTLGTVETLTRSRIAVMLDDGRLVAFDVKDYANIDHGYAATVHKSQGVTVDRVHVLATPGLDAHATYVALSRHRDSVDLHYGRDDFADQGRLVRALSRERGKDMVSDYAPSPEQARHVPPTPVRNPFAGLRITPAAPPLPEPTPLDKAVERYARAAVAILAMRDRGLTELPHQTSAFTDAARALNEIRPEGARDLRTALRADRSVIDQAATGKTAAAIRAMTLEAEIRVDTAQRTDRFIADWQQKVRGLEKIADTRDYPAIGRAKDSLRAMADGLHRDPQLESLLRNGAKELGVSQLDGRSLSQELQRPRVLSLGRGLGR